jgi:hypothetical protein
VKNPFRCRGCEAKDEELKFLRGMFASTRSMTKEPVQPSIAIPERHWSLFGVEKDEAGGAVAIAKPEPRDGGQQTQHSWGREPVEERDAVDEREALHSPEREQ